MSDFLTPTEKRVVNLLVKGLRNQEIASELGIKLGTVKVHFRNIFLKYKVTNRVALAMRITHSPSEDIAAE